MAENSAIEWTHHTFNPWRGCTKVSAGCANCYADTLSKRNPKTLGIWGPNGTRVVAAESQWKQPLKWNREAEDAGERRRVFCASLADVFEDWDGPLHRADGSIVTCSLTGLESDMDSARRRLFQLIDDTPHLDWLLLTKRPENIRRMWPQPINGHDHGSVDQICRNQELRRVVGQQSVRQSDKDGMRPNVWLGATVEDQEQADKRIPELLKCRDLSPVLFLSCEPLLGPVCLREHFECDQCNGSGYAHIGPTLTSACNCNAGGIPGIDIDWVICGGESGHHARPMHPDWARSLRDQCHAAGVPFFFKQWGEWVPRHSGMSCFPHRRIDAEGRDVTWESGLWSESDVHMHKVGKKAAGRLLDGREWNEFPTKQVVS